MPTNNTYPYKSHRSYLTNYMGFISHRMTPLVINSLGVDTHTKKQTNICGHNNFKKQGARKPAAGMCLVYKYLKAFSVESTEYP